MILSTSLFFFILQEFISSVALSSFSPILFLCPLLPPLTECAIFLQFFNTTLSPGEGNYLVENRLVIAVCAFTQLKPRQQGCFRPPLAQETFGKPSLSSPHPIVSASLMKLQGGLQYWQFESGYRIGLQSHILKTCFCIFCPPVCF